MDNVKENLSVKSFQQTINNIHHHWDLIRIMLCELWDQYTMNRPSIRHESQSLVNRIEEMKQINNNVKFNNCFLLWLLLAIESDINAVMVQFMKFSNYVIHPTIVMGFTQRYRKVESRWIWLWMIIIDHIIEMINSGYIFIYYDSLATAIYLHSSDNEYLILRHAIIIYFSSICPPWSMITF